MNRKKLELIRRHLMRENVRERIYQDMLKWRSEISVTIGHAARLFGFSENQLRDWEDYGLLMPHRTANHRQYSLEDLDKLAIIRELLNANYAPGDIPSDIDKLTNIEELRARTTLSSSQEAQEVYEEVFIDRRIEQAKSEAFWHFFASHTLCIALQLMSEFLPNTIIGLILPFDASNTPTLDDGNTSRLGMSLVGWLTENSSSHVLLTTNASFQYPTDYCIYPLVEMKEEEWSEAPGDRTLIVLERPDKRSKKLSLPHSAVRIIRRLLAPLYQEKQRIQTCFGPGMHDEHISVTGYHDILLEELANIIILQGGRSLNGENRWHFCLILLPEAGKEESQPLRQQRLIICAQSKDSPYVVGEPLFPSEARTSIGIRAFQSGRVLYRPEISMKVAMFVDIEGDIKSNIAIPIGAERGQPIAVLYLASYELNAFPPEDQQLLRIMGRFIESALKTYSARFQATQGLRGLLRAPEVVDVFFAEFRSENDFMRDLETLLSNFHAWLDNDRKETDAKAEMLSGEKGIERPYDVISFIALDLDDQENLATRYGSQIMRRLDKTMGLRIQEYITSLVTRSASCQLYYMYADRFYLILRGFSLEKAREVAVKLQRSFSGNIAVKQSDVSDSVLIIPDVTVHLAVSSYKREKLNQMLEEKPSVVDVSTKISQELDVALKQGLGEGGNVIMSFDPYSKVFTRWEPPKQ